MSINIYAALGKIAEGDTDGMSELYTALSVRIYNYARTITKSKEMSEDVTHDVFLQIFKHAARISKMANPVAYIMVTARNHAYDHIRRNKQITASIDETPDVYYTSIPIDKLAIEEALLKLPVNQRETIYLHHICGYKQSEVASITGVPLVTVKWRCSKAMSKLQEYLG